MGVQHSCPDLLLVLYSSAHFISEAQCSRETACVHVRSEINESSLNQQNRGDRQKARRTRTIGTKRGEIGITASQRQGQTSSANTETIEEREAKLLQRCTLV